MNLTTSTDITSKMGRHNEERRREARRRWGSTSVYCQRQPRVVMEVVQKKVALLASSVSALQNESDSYDLLLSLPKLWQEI